MTAKQLKWAHVVVLGGSRPCSRVAITDTAAVVVSFDNAMSFLRVSSFWLPHLRQFAPNVRAHAKWVIRGHT